MWYEAHRLQNKVFADQIFKSPHENISYLSPETDGLKNSDISYSLNSICQNCKGSVIDSVKSYIYWFCLGFIIVKKPPEMYRKT